MRRVWAVAGAIVRAATPDEERRRALGELDRQWADGRPVHCFFLSKREKRGERLIYQGCAARASGKWAIAVRGKMIANGK